MHLFWNFSVTVRGLQFLVSLTILLWIMSINCLNKCIRISCFRGGRWRSVVVVGWGFCWVGWCGCLVGLFCWGLEWCFGWFRVSWSRSKNWDGCFFWFRDQPLPSSNPRSADVIFSKSPYFVAIIHNLYHCERPIHSNNKNLGDSSTLIQRSQWLSLQTKFFELCLEVL